MAEAKLHFQLGLNHLRDPEGERIEPAYLEFKRTYELSASPRVLGNIGYCAMKLERYTEAVGAYREYIEKVPNIDPVERKQIEQDLQMMTAGAATFVANFSGEGEWMLFDERLPVHGPSIKNTYGPYHSETSLLIQPGHHLVRLMMNGEEQGRLDFNSTSGQSQSHTFTPRPPPEEQAVSLAPPPPAMTEVTAPQPSSSSAKRSYVGPLITMGVGGALLIGGAVTGYLALGKMKDLEKRCPEDVCRGTGYQSDVDSARRLGTMTDVLVAGGGVVVVGGAVWLLVTRAKSREHAQGKTSTLSAGCSRGACRFGVQGRF